METGMEASLASSESHDGPEDSSSSVMDGEPDTWGQYDPIHDDVARNQSKCEKRDFCSQTKPTIDYPTVSGYTNKFMKFLDKLDREMAPIKSGIRDLQNQVKDLGITQLENLNMMYNIPQITTNVNVKALQCCDSKHSDQTNHSLSHSNGSTHTSHTFPHSNGSVHAIHTLPRSIGNVQFVGKVVTRKVPAVKDPCEMNSSCSSTFTSSSKRSYQTNSKFLEQGTSIRLVSKSVHDHQNKPAIEIYIVASPDAFPKLTTIKQQPPY